MSTIRYSEFLMTCAIVPNRLLQSNPKWDPYATRIMWKTVLYIEEKRFIERTRIASWRQRAKTVVAWKFNKRKYESVEASQTVEKKSFLDSRHNIKTLAVTSLPNWIPSAESNRLLFILCIVLAKIHRHRIATTTRICF